MTSQILKNEGTFDPTADTASIEGLKLNKAYPVLESPEKISIIEPAQKYDLPSLPHISFEHPFCLLWGQNEVALSRENNLVKLFEPNLFHAELCFPYLITVVDQKPDFQSSEQDQILKLKNQQSSLSQINRVFQNSLSLSAKQYKFKVNVRVVSKNGDISHIEGAYETNNHFHKVTVVQGHLLGINYTFAKVFVQKIDGPKQWVVLDIADEQIDQRIKKHIEEYEPKESTGGSGEDWSRIDQIFNSWVDKTLLIASFRDQKVKVFDLEHMINQEQDAQFDELMQLKVTGPVKFCCLLETDFIVAARGVHIFKTKTHDFDRYSSQKQTEFEPDDILNLNAELGCKSGSKVMLMGQGSLYEYPGLEHIFEIGYAPIHIGKNYFYAFADGKLTKYSIGPKSKQDIRDFIINNQFKKLTQILLKQKVAEIGMVKELVGVQINQILYQDTFEIIQKMDKTKIEQVLAKLDGLSSVQTAMLHYVTSKSKQIMNSLKITSLREQDQQHIANIKLVLAKIDKLTQVIKMLQFYQQTDLGILGTQFFQEIHAFYTQRQHFFGTTFLSALLCNDSVLDQKQGQFDVLDLIYIVDKYPHGILALYHYVLDIQMVNYMQKKSLKTKFKQILGSNNNLVYVESIFNVQNYLFLKEQNLSQLTLNVKNLIKFPSKLMPLQDVISQLVIIQASCQVQQRQTIMNLCRMVLDSYEPEDIVDQKQFLKQVKQIVPKYKNQLAFIERFEPNLDTKIYSEFVQQNWEDLPHLKSVSCLQKSIIEEYLKVENPQLLYIYQLDCGSDLQAFGTALTTITKGGNVPKDILRRNLHSLGPHTEIGFLEAARSQNQIKSGDFLAEINYQPKDQKIEKIMAKYHQDIGKIGGFSAQKTILEKNEPMSEPVMRLWEQDLENLYRDYTKNV